MFETIEAIPDYEKSGHAHTCPAETDLTSGQYAVVARYLRVLWYTLFYKKWAINVMSCPSNGEKVEEHPE